MGRLRGQKKDFTLFDMDVARLAIINDFYCDVSFDLEEELLTLIIMKVLAGIRTPNDHDNEVRVLVHLGIAHRGLEKVSMFVDPALKVDWGKHCHRLTYDADSSLAETKVRSGNGHMHGVGMDLRLDGKRALVCGASRGIGRATAQELALQGASVVLLARDQSALEEVLASLATSNTQHHVALSIDMYNENLLVHSVNNLVDNAGAIHIVVNNTSGPPAGRLVDSDVESLTKAFQNHILVSHQLMSLLTPGMKAAGYGRVINIVSTSVKQPIEGLGVSNTIRGAMASWSKTLATELGLYGITVNNVLPGATETERLTSIITGKASKSGQTPDAVRSDMLSEIPAGRFASPSEIANAVAFLASPAASYINGTSILVDGGRTRALS